MGSQELQPRATQRPERSELIRRQKSKQRPEFLSAKAWGEALTTTIGGPLWLGAAAGLAMFSIAAAIGAF